jgi:hypothetical protein
VSGVTILRIDCDARWSTIGWQPTRPPWRRSGHVDAAPIPVTPRVLLWTPAAPSADPNALASALLTFLQLPIQQLQGPAYLTGFAADTERPAPLTPTQHRAFTSTLQALQAMPDFLALHAQAGRIAAAWFCPTTTRSFP